MKRRLTALLKLLLALAICAGAAYLGAKATLLIRSRALVRAGAKAWNIQSAGALLRYLYAGEGELALLGASVAACCALLFAKELFGPEDAPFGAKWLCLLPLGLLLGRGAVALLQSLDEIRHAGARNFGFIPQYVCQLALSGALALLLRGCACKAAREMLGDRAILPASAFLECAAWLVLIGPSAVTAVNGLFFGALAALMYIESRSLWPETLLRFGFVSGARLLGAYPGGGAYWVSGSLWAGARFGLEGSLTLTIMLLLALSFYALARQRRTNHG